MAICLHGLPPRNPTVIMMKHHISSKEEIFFKKTNLTNNLENCQGHQKHGESKRHIQDQPEETR